MKEKKIKTEIKIYLNRQITLNKKIYIQIFLQIL